MTLSLVSKPAWTTAAAVDSVEHEVVKAVAGVVSTAAGDAVSNVAHANAMTICAVESAMPTCEVTIVLNSEIADAAGAGAATSTSRSIWESGSFDSNVP